MTHLNSVMLPDRICNSGPVLDHVHLVDLFLYDSSMFANVAIMEDTKWTSIIDTGTSDSAGAIINYFQFNGIQSQRVLLIPTHYHFDHAGGLTTLIEFFQKKGAEVTVLTNKAMKLRLQAPESHEKAARRVLGDIVGTMAPISDDNIQLITDQQEFQTGERFSIRLLPTPGHSDDHVSPVFTLDGDRIIFLGEAFGINLRGNLTPIPASSAPDFNSGKYLTSIQRILDLRPDIGFFSHYGGIAGAENIQTTGKNAIKNFREFRKLILCLHDQGFSTRQITERIADGYADQIATYSLGTALAQNLAFSIIYGILMDERNHNNPEHLRE